MLIEFILALIVIRLIVFFIQSPPPERLVMILVVLYFIGLYLYVSYKYPGVLFRDV